MTENKKMEIVSIENVKDYDNFIANMTPDTKEKYLRIASSISLDDKTSIQGYGSDVSNIIDKNSDIMLSNVNTRASNEMNEYMADILTQLKMINVSQLGALNFLRNIPILNKLAINADKVINKSKGIISNVEDIKNNIAASQLQVLEQNNNLANTFTENALVINEIKELIIAAKLKLNEINDEFNTLKSNPDTKPWKLQEVGQFIINLRTKITNLIQIEDDLNTAQLDIISLQANNDIIIEKCEQVLNYYFPNWKRQIGQILMANKQAEQIESLELIIDANNKMSEEATKKVTENSIRTAKLSGRTFLDYKTVKTKHDELTKRLKEVRAIHEKNEANGKKLEEQIRLLQKHTEEEMKMIESNQ